MKLFSIFTLLVFSPVLSLAAEANSGPVLQISPKPILFPKTGVSHQGYASVILTNVGSADLLVTKLALYGGAIGNFGFSGDGCTGFTVVPGESCGLELEFSPGQQGLYYSWLLVFGNESGSPQDVLLLGCGSHLGSDCKKP